MLVAVAVVVVAETWFDAAVPLLVVGAGRTTVTVLVVGAGPGVWVELLLGDGEPPLDEQPARPTTDINAKPAQSLLTIELYAR